MTQEELDKIVKQHQHWLEEDCEGWEGMMADLRGADLRGADLSELKATASGEIRARNALLGYWWYEKSEADKVIAELKAEKAQAEDDCAYWKTMSRKCADDNEVMAKQRAEAFKRERHHKYKRCLDKAEMCKARYDAEDAKVNGYGASWEYISKEMKYWERWRWHWETLAEKFKEAE